MLKRFRTRYLFGLLVTGLFLAINQGILRLDLLERLELIAYDARMAATTTHGEIDPRVVIIDIDERSLKAEGHWPWNRLKLAKLLTTLTDVYQMDIVAFDVVFAERDSAEELELMEQLAAESGAIEFLEQYRQFKPQLNPDALFANALSDRRAVLGYYFDKSDVRSTFTGEIGEPIFAQGTPYYPMLRLPRKLQNGELIEAPVTSYTGNVAELANSALASGYYSINSVDRDGILRRIQLMEKYDGGIYESLALVLARLYIGTDLELITGINESGQQVVEALDIGTGAVPIDKQGSTYIPYKRRAFSFRYVSATDVLNQVVEKPEDLEFAIGLIGTTAAGLVDLRNSPLQQNNYPGVEVHATTVAGLLDGEFKSRPYYSTAAEFISLLLVGLILTLLLPPLGALSSTAVWLATSAALVGLNMFFWTQENTVLSIAPVLVLALSLYVLNIAYGYLFESRNKAKLSGLFGQYIPPELVADMAKDPERYTLEAKREQLSVLFTDVRGFTTISEGLDPHTLSELMNELLSPMTRIVHETGGTIDKYMGDAMMAFWGAPVAQPAHAEKALQAGMLMLAELAEINSRFAQRGWPEVRIGIGVNSGDMNVGNMGSEFRMAYTVLGDAVNLGSRVEGLTKNYGVDFIATEYTKAETPDWIYRKLDAVRVKGKEKPVEIFEPIAHREGVDAKTLEELAQYHAALEQYAQRGFAQAREALTALHSENPRYVYQMYVERCEYFLESPPEADWDGVYTHTTK